MKNLVFQSKYLAFRSKTLDFGWNTKYFESNVLKIKYQVEIPGFSHLKFETLGISSEIASIWKKVWNPWFKWTLCISSGFCSYLRIQILLGKYYTPAHLDQQKKHLTPIVDSFPNPTGESSDLIQK